MIQTKLRIDIICETMMVIAKYSDLAEDTVLDMALNDLVIAGNKYAYHLLYDSEELWQMRIDITSANNKKSSDHYYIKTPSQLKSDLIFIYNNEVPENVLINLTSFLKDVILTVKTNIKTIESDMSNKEYILEYGE